MAFSNDGDDYDDDDDDDDSDDDSSSGDSNSRNNDIESQNLRFFYNLLTAPRTVFTAHAFVAKVLPCANHVQHIG